MKSWRWRAPRFLRRVVPLLMALCVTGALLPERVFAANQEIMLKSLTIETESDAYEGNLQAVYVLYSMTTQQPIDRSGKVVEFAASGNGKLVLSQEKLTEIHNVVGEEPFELWEIPPSGYRPVVDGPLLEMKLKEINNYGVRAITVNVTRAASQTGKIERKINSQDGTIKIKHEKGDAYKQYLVEYDSNLLDDLQSGQTPGFPYGAMIEGRYVYCCQKSLSLPLKDSQCGRRYIKVPTDSLEGETELNNINKEKVWQSLYWGFPYLAGSSPICVMDPYNNNAKEYCQAENTQYAVWESMISAGLNEGEEVKRYQLYNAICSSPTYSYPGAGASAGDPEIKTLGASSDGTVTLSYNGQAEKWISNKITLSGKKWNFCNLRLSGGITLGDSEGNPLRSSRAETLSIGSSFYFVSESPLDSDGGTAEIATDAFSGGSMEVALYAPISKEMKSPEKEARFQNLIGADVTEPVSVKASMRLYTGKKPETPPTPPETPPTPPETPPTPPETPPTPPETPPTPPETPPTTPETPPTTPETPELPPNVPPDTPVYRPGDTLPDANDPDSPDVIVVINDEDIPLAYFKTWDPEPQKYVYIDDEGIPLAGLPPLGQSGALPVRLLIAGAAMCVAGCMGRKRGE